MAAKQRNVCGPSRDGQLRAAETGCLQRRSLQEGPFSPLGQLSMAAGLQGRALSCPFTELRLKLEKRIQGLVPTLTVSASLFSLLPPLPPCRAQLLHSVHVSLLNLLSGPISPSVPRLTFSIATSSPIPCDTSDLLKSGLCSLSHLQRYRGIDQR